VGAFLKGDFSGNAETPTVSTTVPISLKGSTHGDDNTAMTCTLMVY